MTLFLRLLEVGVNEKPAALKEAARGGVERVFEVEPGEFAQVPGSPFAYWVSGHIRGAFLRFRPLECAMTVIRVGVATGNDGRFLRLWWEPTRLLLSSWRSLAKGGSFSRFYADITLLIDWRANGEPIEISFVGGRVRKPDFGRAGLTWPARTQSGFGMRALPASCVFGHKGPTVFVEDDSSEHLLTLLSITTSSGFRYLVDLQMAFGSYEVGVIQRTPVPDLDATSTTLLLGLARRAWSLKRTLDTIHETSHAFLLPSALRARLGPFDPPAMEAEIGRIQAQIDDFAFKLYGIDGDDRAEIERWAHKGKPIAGATGANAGAEPDGAPEPDDETDGDDEEATGSERDSLLSWSAGVAFGRFDVRLATGERQAPAEPEPFDALPARSPGMRADEASARAVLVDDPGHKDDISAAVRVVLERIDVPAPEDLRAWLAKDFFALHLKMYSKSRRKAPIYWQLATPSASYSVWLYVHALGKETLRTVQNDYVVPKIRHEDRELQRLHEEFGASPSAAQRKQLARQEAFVDELRGFLDEVQRVAPLWNPDLDDGVVINAAPLFRLVPQHKPWQKELRATWDGLCNGKYEWSHLAMHLWPERVLPQCATDRSLAIAHSGPPERDDLNLEKIFWEQGDKDKWQPRKSPTRPLAELVAERTLPTVKAALASPGATAAARPAAKRGMKGKRNA